MKRVKMEEKLLWMAYMNSPTLFRTVYRRLLIISEISGNFPPVLNFGKIYSPIHVLSYIGVLLV